MHTPIDEETITGIKDAAAHIVEHLPRALFYVVVVAALYFVVKRVISFLTTRTSATFAGPALRATKWFFIFAAVMLVCSAYGADIGYIWTMLGTVGALVAVGFVAVWSVLSNLSCTVLILFFRPFEVGDDIEFTDPIGLRGKVINLNFAYTTLRDNEGRLIQIPNNLFFQRIVKRIPIRVETDLSLAEQLTKKESSEVK